MYLIEDPQGGRPPPHFYSRRFCRSVCRSTQSIRRRRNVKGNFAWGLYGGFLAGSWRIVGGTSASSRQNFGKFAAESRQVLGGPKNFKGCGKDSLREAKRFPGWPKGAEKSAKRRPRAPQKLENNESVFPNRFWMPPRALAGLIFPRFWLHFGSMLGAQIVNFSC